MPKKKQLTKRRRTQTTRSKKGNFDLDPVLDPVLDLDLNTTLHPFRV